MLGFGTNKVKSFGNGNVLEGANIPRYRFTCESKPDGLAKGLGSDSFSIHCERIEATKERVP